MVDEPKHFEQLKESLTLREVCALCDKPKPRNHSGTISGWFFDAEYRAITDRWTCSCLAASDSPDQTKKTKFRLAGPPPLTEAAEEIPKSSIPKADALVDRHNRQTEAEHEALAMPETESLFADRWIIDKEIGRGPFGRVFLAHDETLRQTVAIKVIKPVVSENRRIIKRIFQECAKLQSAKHKGMCTIFDFGTTKSGQDYIVTEFIDGPNLQQRIQSEGFLDVEEALRMCVQITDAMEHFHSRGIIHRGIKPTNIFFTEDGSVKMSDFGISKAIPPFGEATHTLMRSFEVFGDPAYMSPEQCLGRELDPRSDIYSLGCIMYEALIGKRVFKSKNVAEQAMAQLTASPPPFRKQMFNCDVPQQVESVVFKCLAKDCGARYENASALRKQVLALLKGDKIRIKAQPGQAAFSGQAVHKAANLKKEAEAPSRPDAVIEHSEVLLRQQSEKGREITRVSDPTKLPGLKNMWAVVSQYFRWCLEERPKQAFVWLALVMVLVAACSFVTTAYLHHLSTLTDSTNLPVSTASVRSDDVGGPKHTSRDAVFEDLLMHFRQFYTPEYKPTLSFDFTINERTGRLENITNRTPNPDNYLSAKMWEEIDSAIGCINETDFDGRLRGDSVGTATFHIDGGQMWIEQGFRRFDMPKRTKRIPA